MENSSGKSGGGFLNGFLWGLLIGGIVVFLLGTKRGKKLIKVITEEGLEGMSEIGDLITDIEEEREIEEESLPVQNFSENVQTSNGVHKNTKHAAHTTNESIVSRIKKPARFFKGIPKRK